MELGDPGHAPGGGIRTGLREHPVFNDLALLITIDQTDRYKDTTDCYTPFLKGVLQCLLQINWDMICGIYIYSTLAGPVQIAQLCHGLYSMENLLESLKHNT